MKAVLESYEVAKRKAFQHECARQALIAEAIHFGVFYRHNDEELLRKSGARLFKAAVRFERTV